MARAGHFFFYEIHHLKKKNPFRFRFRVRYFFYSTIAYLFRYNDLKINGFCRSLKYTSVNFRKPNHGKSGAKWQCYIVYVQYPLF